jgi:hypothetical protein
VERIHLVVSGGGDVAAHGQERRRAGRGAPAARDLVLLDHAQVPLSLVVDRYPQAVQELQHLDPMAVQPDGRRCTRTSCRTRPLCLIHADAASAAISVG